MASNRQKIIFFSLFLFFNLLLFGQSIDTMIVLNPVEISANKNKYLVGSKIQTIDSFKLSANSSGTLSDILNQYLPIYLKENAGGLATIRFRGTSADHTSIMYEGININSLTLGQSNISNIPTFLFNDIKVQYGSSSSLYGTDAIGGSIHLNNKTNWNKGFSTYLEQEIASFNSYFSGAKFGFSNNKFDYKIKAYHFQKKNNFPFLNLSIKDFEKNEFVKDTTKNSTLRNYGVLQELNIRISNNLISYAKFWYNNNWYEIQPNMSKNYYSTDFAEIMSKNVRFLSGLKYYNGAHKLTTKFAYVYDYQLYNNILDQVISTKSFIATINYFHNKLWKGDFNIGTNFQQIIPEVYAYNDIIKENRIDVFSSYKKTLFPHLTTTINLRESIVQGYKNHFSPSIGFNYKIIDNPKQNINFKLSYANSYKIPTLNQRFWYPSGNPNILPENGDNYELNTSMKFIGKKSKYTIDITGYLMEVDNWIQWVNIGVWQPRNIKKVRNIGFEFSLNSDINIYKTIIKTGLSYSFTNATEVKSYYNHTIKKGEQLIYTPKHIGKIYVNIQHNNWNFNTTGSFIGERFAEDYSTVDSYNLFNARLGKKLQMGKHNFHISFNVNNVFNKSYQSWKFYAMPGRNCAINLKYYY